MLHIIPLRLALAGFAALGGGMVAAGISHNAKVNRYLSDNPDANPDEIEESLLQQGIDENLECLFGKMKGRTTGCFGGRIYWYRDRLGRARYTHGVMEQREKNITKFDHWLQHPPQTFRDLESIQRPMRKKRKRV